MEIYETSGIDSSTPELSRVILDIDSSVSHATAALETRVANLERRVAQEASDTLRNPDATWSARHGALAAEGDAQLAGQTDDLPGDCTQSEDGVERASNASSEAESA